MIIENPSPSLSLLSSFFDWLHNRRKFQKPKNGRKPMVRRSEAAVVRSIWWFASSSFLGMEIWFLWILFRSI